MLHAEGRSDTKSQDNMEHGRVILTDSCNDTALRYGALVYLLPGVGVAIAMALVPVGVTPLGVIIEGVACGVP
jgi:hypothetical protein